MAQINPEILMCNECGILAPLTEFKPVARIIGFRRAISAEKFVIVYACPYCETKEHVEHDRDTYMKVLNDQKS